MHKDTKMPSTILFTLNRFVMSEATGQLEKLKNEVHPALYADEGTKTASYLHQHNTNTLGKDRFECSVCSKISLSTHQLRFH